MHRRHHNEMDMCSGTLLPKIIRYTLPLVLTGVLQLLYNAADVVVVGQFAGEEALAAVGSTGSLINLIVNIFMGLGVGASVVIARAYGARDFEAVHRGVHTAILVAAIGGVLVGIVGIFTARPLLELMDSPENVIDGATLYMQIYFIGMPANMLYTFGASILRAVGDTKRPLYYLSVAGIINVVLNLFLVIVCNLSVAGVAIATVISQIVSMVLVMVFSTLSLWLGMEDTLNSRLRSDIDVRSASTDVSALEAAVDETLRQAGASRADTWTYRYLSFSALPTPEGFVSSVSFTESDALIASPATFQVMVVEDYNRMLGRSETLAPGEALLECTRGNYEGDTLRLLDETFAIKARISDGLGAGQALASIYDYYCLVVDSMDTLRRLDSEQQAAYGDRASAIRTSMSFALLPASPQLSEQVAALLRSQADADGFTSVAERTELRENLMTLYGGLLFVGLFLGLLFTMAMILIIYYKQITEGYEDRERYRIMRKVGLSRREIRRSISSQILIVFFLPLAAAGLHVAFAFPGIVTMFRALSMTNVTLIAGCALGSFAGFAALYGAVYLLTARVYYRIVSE